MKVIVSFISYILNTYNALLIFLKEINISLTFLGFFVVINL